jgi:hypothetical protein
MNNKLHWLNVGNPCGLIQMLVLGNLLEKFPNEDLVGLEIGSAYGGGVEFAAKLWKGRGKFYGYDTFEGHPRDLAEDQSDKEAWCMDMWYEDKNFGTEKIKYDYQRKILDDQGLDNAILVKGRVNEKSFDDIEKAHFVMIDLDMDVPTRIAYEAIKDKVVVGGYLLMHDSLPEDHLPKIHRLVYEEIIKEGRWKIIKQSYPGLVTVLERWKNVWGDLNGQLLSMNHDGAF